VLNGEHCHHSHASHRCLVAIVNVAMALSRCRSQRCMVNNNGTRQKIDFPVNITPLPVIPVGEASSLRWRCGLMFLAVTDESQGPMQIFPETPAHQRGPKTKLLALTLVRHTKAIDVGRSGCACGAQKVKVCWVGWGGDKGHEKIRKRCITHN
jgi:hypothetical protein